MQLSPGSWSILALALLSSIALYLFPIPPHIGESYWTFSLDLDLLYQPAVKQWNEAHPDPAEHITTYVIGTDPLSRRLQSGFLSGTPVPDLADVESSMAANFFSGPLDAVGFTDLTDLIHQEGLDKKINPASFSPWTNRGRIFGIPHDVHPVLLAYRADIVEAAGIDVSKIETWDDFIRVMSPLMQGPDGERFLLNVWETNPRTMEILLLQAGGGFFDPDLKPILNSEVNARVLATIVTWIAGPKRICVDAPDFDAEGNYLYLHGEVLCSLMPDWLAGIWMKDLPGMSGKMKLMPLPAWDKGGLRTSVVGGTMLVIPKRAPNFERSWAFALHLCLSPDLARDMYRRVGIITPVRELWNDPVFDQPNPYFAGQPSGRMYIQMAPYVPMRTSSPFKPQAVVAVNDALIRLKHFAVRTNTYDIPSLQAQARIELETAQEDIQRKMAANAFLSSTP
jgi:arabinosaccharide transport system substrate-binding protein